MFFPHIIWTQKIRIVQFKWYMQIFCFPLNIPWWWHLFMQQKEIWIILLNIPEWNIIIIFREFHDGCHHILVTTQLFIPAESLRGFASDFEAGKRSPSGSPSPKWCRRRTTASRADVIMGCCFINIIQTSFWLVVWNILYLSMYWE